MTDVLRKRNNPQRILVMQKEMAAAPCSYDRLAQVSGLDKRAVQHWIKQIRANVHIAGWGEDRRGRKFVPLFQWGAGNDVPRPGQSRTAAERMRALRADRKIGLK